MAKVDTAALISVSAASKMGVSALIREAEAGRDQVLLRNNRPVAAVVNVERLEELQHLQEDLADISMVAARMVTAGDRRHALDDVLEHFGYTRDQLRGVDG